ncbi:hypothetical protein PIB30_043069 [Stylosanthes scabra]|uniref:Uncharacterized protein n=1 Tax=Stylosanthes scabra TaxID=79078 RepID=A0ABU6RG49_9FABA|nr:hypothetical protein [Stylosanthes scabra]
MDGPQNNTDILDLGAQLLLFHDTNLYSSRTISNGWNYWPRRHEVRLKPVQEYRKKTDDMALSYGFLWRPYRGMDLPDGLQEELSVFKYFGPLLSFECVEWHSADRVMRQF